MQRSQRFMWAITTSIFLTAVVSVIQRDWAWAVTLFVISVVSAFINRRAIRKLRERQPSRQKSRRRWPPSGQRL
jgi:membrane protein implicated in regulation of membrane protease activity